jgi:hypothetical protein
MSDICIFLSTQKYDLVSALIRRATNCDWSHCGFFNRTNHTTYSAMADGKGLTFRPVGPTQKMLLLTAPGVEAAYQKALEWEGTPYDFKGVFGMVIGRNWDDPTKLFCDLTVFRAQRETGNPLVNHTFLPDIHLTPRDILLSPYVRSL